MFRTKKITIFLVGIVSVLSLMACQKVNKNQMEKANTQGIVLEMEMDANYSDSDPFENGRLFCVREDIDTLKAEISFAMEGEEGLLEIKDRNAKDVLWSKRWDGTIQEDHSFVSLPHLQKEKEYVVRFTGTNIKYALVSVAFESDLVQEKERPSK